MTFRKLFDVRFQPRLVRRTLGALFVFIVTAGLACAAGHENAQTSNADGGSAASAGSGGSQGTGGNAGTGQAGDFQFDGGMDDGGPESCQFVDLLFVIDNSPSMGPKQEKLAAAFPSFVDAMFTKLPPNVDLHVGITTTSFFSGSCGESVTNCVSTASQQEILDHYVKPTDGDTGTNGEQGRFFEHEGKSFFAANTSDADQKPLKSWFTGAAIAAGETGCSFEMMSAAAGYAAHPANSATNGNFFRDESSVLLVVILTDEPDKSPEGTDVYANMLRGVKSKCGGDKCILVAGLIDPCIQGVDNVLWKFMNAFGEPPIWGDVEDDGSQYSKVVGDALAQVVKQTCDEIGVPK
jgi:hypothetical protein